MSTFWIVYCICAAVIIILSGIVRRFFEVDGENVPRFVILLIWGFSFIPWANILFTIAAIITFIGLCCEGELSLKEKPFDNDDLNKFFLG